MRTGGVFFLALAAFPAACGSPTAPEFDLVLSIEDSVVARRSPNQVNFSVAVRVSNHDTRTAYYDNCGHSLQRRDGNEWRAVFSPPCVPGQYSIELTPGNSRTFELSARGDIGSATWPAIGAAGEYRVILWLTAIPNNSYGFSPKPLGPRSRTSPTFSAREVVIVF